MVDDTVGLQPSRKWAGGCNFTQGVAESRPWRAAVQGRSELIASGAFSNPTRRSRGKHVANGQDTETRAVKPMR